MTSSPKFLQSNGAAEAAVQIAKNILKKCEDSPNSFIVKTERGNTVRRNRWHLIPTPYKNRC